MAGGRGAGVGGGIEVCVGGVPCAACSTPRVAASRGRRRAGRARRRARPFPHHPVLAGNPYFTTDTAAALRAAEMNAEVFLKVRPCAVASVAAAPLVTHLAFWAPMRRARLGAAGAVVLARTRWAAGLWPTRGLGRQQRQLLMRGGPPDMHCSHARSASPGAPVTRGVTQATKVDGIYDADPVKHPDAKRYDRLSYRRVAFEGLEVCAADERGAQGGGPARSGRAARLSVRAQGRGAVRRCAPGFRDSARRCACRAPPSAVRRPAAALPALATCLRTQRQGSSSYSVACRLALLLCHPR